MSNIEKRRGNIKISVDGFRMKYKVGDKIVVREWDDLFEEFGDDGTLGGIYIEGSRFFSLSAENVIKQYGSRVFTITKIWPGNRDLQYEFEVKEIKIMIGRKWLEPEQESIQNEQETFRDLMGVDINVGDTVLHFWTLLNHDGFAKRNGEKGGVKCKMAKVIKFTRQGVGIEWKEKGKTRKSTVFKSRNRLLILKNGNIEIDEEMIRQKTLEAYESYKKGMITRNKNLQKVVDKQSHKIAELIEEKRQAISLIEELQNKGNRFKLMDI